MTMRVLHVLDHSIPVHSGYSFRTRAIIEGQRALGWETFHVTSAKHPLQGDPVEDVDGLRFYRTAPITEGLILARLPVARQLAIIRSLESRLDDLVSELRPDVIHAHSPALNGLAAQRVAHRRGVPFVYEVRAFWEDAAVDHGTTTEGSVRYRLTRALETHVLRRADAVTCICEGLRGDIIARGIDPGRVTVIPNAVDAERFAYDRPKDEALAAALGLNGHWVIGFIGSFYAYEGLELLVRALPSLRTKRPDVRVLLVGGGPQESRLRALAQELGVLDDIVFAGRVPQDEVSRYYTIIDVLAYPRLSMRLTELVTPLKPLEAMAQGNVFVASNVGGHRELIRDGETGLLFGAGEVADLVAALQRVLDDPQALGAMREAGRNFVENERNWPRSVARYEAVYLAAGARPADAAVTASHVR